MLYVEVCKYLRVVVEGSETQLEMLEGTGSNLK
jgi:hypothetical protein